MDDPIAEDMDRMDEDARWRTVGQTLDDLCTTLEALVPAVASLQARVAALEARQTAEDGPMRALMESGFAPRLEKD